MPPSITANPTDNEILDFTGDPGDLLNYWESIADLGEDFPTVFMAGLQVQQVERGGRHDGEPALRITLADDFGRHEAGRLVIQENGLREYGLEWQVYYGNPQAAAENLAILQVKTKRPKVMSLELDYLPSDGETIEEAIANCSARFGISGRVVNPHGPGGGCPVVQFSGLTANLEKMLRSSEPYGYDLDETEVMDYLDV